MATGAGLAYQLNANALAMARAVMDSQAKVVGASFSGGKQAAALFTANAAAGVFGPPGTTGIVLGSGRLADVIPGGVGKGANGNAKHGEPGWLDVDFIPASGRVLLKLTLVSKDLQGIVDTLGSDLIGVWINGQPVNVVISNDQADPPDAPSGGGGSSGDADTVPSAEVTLTMALHMTVSPNEVNSLRIGLTESSDGDLDVALFISEDPAFATLDFGAEETDSQIASSQTTFDDGLVETSQGGLVANPDYIELRPNQSVTADIIANDTNPSPNALFITHINGIPVTAGSVVTLPTGQTVRLNADGTVTVTADQDVETVRFGYTVATGQGNGVSSTGIVTINTIPCFVSGTLIRTPRGEIPVERLVPGDLVLTLDEGPQPLRWTGRRTVAAAGSLAPIHIRAGTFGAHGHLRVSPQHRILLRDGLAEFLFGEQEVLVAAKDLVNDRSVRVQEGGVVTYVHLLFDRHQVVWSEGLPSESFLPGPQIRCSLDRAVMDEICAIFPELDPETGHGYGAAARRLLRAHETRVLLTADRAAA